MSVTTHSEPARVNPGSAPRIRRRITDEEIDRAGADLTKYWVYQAGEWRSSTADEVFKRKRESLPEGSRPRSIWENGYSEIGRIKRWDYGGSNFVIAQCSEGPDEHFVALLDLPQTMHRVRCDSLPDLLAFLGELEHLFAFMR